MEHEICSSLDDFLSEAMELDEQSAFAVHLASCRKCQECKAQSQANDKMLLMQNARVTMRPQFHNDILSSLDEVTKAATPDRRKLSEESKSDCNSVARVRLASVVLMSKVTPWGIGTIAVAASVVWFAFTASNPSADQAPLLPNPYGTDVTQLQIRPIEPSQVSLEHPVAVIGAPGYLCARIDSDESDIEFYIVRPISQRN